MTVLALMPKQISIVTETVSTTVTMMGHAMSLKSLAAQIHLLAILVRKPQMKTVLVSI